MNRRTFIGASTVTQAGVQGCKIRNTDQVSSVKSLTPKTKIAGLTLEALREQYRSDLFDEFLPFVEKYVIDREYGGFMCNVDRDGTQDSNEDIDGDGHLQQLPHLAQREATR